MSYIEKNLSPKEKLIIKPKIHWFVMVNGPLIFSAGVMLLSLDWMKDTGSWMYRSGVNSWWYMISHYTFSDVESFGANLVPLLALLAGVYETIMGLLRKTSIEMGLTTRRVVMKEGLMHTDTDELSFSDIESIDVHQSPFGKCLDFGDITFNSLYHQGSGGRRQLTFRWISNPSKIRRIALAGLDAYAKETPRALA